MYKLFNFQKSILYPENFNIFKQFPFAHLSNHIQSSLQNRYSKITQRKLFNFQRVTLYPENFNIFKHKVAV